MSVKCQRRGRQNSTVHQSRDSTITPIQHPQESSHLQYILCHRNRIQLHRKLIQAFSLHLVCVVSNSNSSKNNKNSELQQRQEKTEKQQESVWEETETGLSFQVLGGNLNVNKAQVKHSFNVMTYLGEGIQFIRLEVAIEDIIMVKSCNFNAKNGVRIHVVSDINKINSRQQNSCLIKPFQLLEQNMRLRAQKLNRSTTKTIKFSTQFQKKITLNWNREQPPIQPQADWRPKRQAIKSAVFNIEDPSPAPSCSSMTPNIKGVEYKKSIDKYDKYERQRNKSRSFSNKRTDLNSSLKNVLQSKNTHLHKQNGNGRSKLGTSKSYKTMNVSYAEEKVCEPALKNKIVNIEGEEQELSSQSYYTAKKDIQQQIEIPKRLQHKKITQTSSKQNEHQPPASTSSAKKINSKWGYSQYRNAKQIELNTMLSSASVLDPKRFNKNISQAKIAQISRTLITDKKNKK